MANKIPKKIIKIIHLAVIVIIVIVSAWSARQYHINTETKEYRRLLETGQNIAIALSLVNPMALNGDSADLNKPEFKNISEKLQLISDINSHIRRITLLGQKSGETIVYVDIFSKKYARNSSAPKPAGPGDFYSSFNDSAMAAIIDGLAYQSGQQQDTYGKYISVITPIPLKLSGQKNISVLVETSTDYWMEKLALSQILSYLSGLAAIWLYFLKFIYPKKSLYD